MTKVHNALVKYSLESLRNPKLTQQEALELFESINYGPIPELTNEEYVKLFQIAHPGAEVEIDEIDRVAWFDDDTVSDAEELAYVESLNWDLDTK